MQLAEHDNFPPAIDDALFGFGTTAAVPLMNPLQAADEPSSIVLFGIFRAEIAEMKHDPTSTSFLLKGSVHVLAAGYGCLRDAAYSSKRSSAATVGFCRGGDFHGNRRRGSPREFPV
jgi:hypothetical protein